MTWRVEGREGIYWVYPADAGRDPWNRMVGAVGVVTHGYHGWVAQPVKRGRPVKGWCWSAPTRRDSLAFLYRWLETT